MPSTDAPKAPLPRNADLIQAGQSSADLPRIAAACCSAELGAVTVLAAEGPYIDAAYGFDPAVPPPVAALYERVVWEGRIVVVDGADECFAGIPIRSPLGETFGVLWVADDRPREGWAAAVEEFLPLLASQYAKCLELRDLRLERASALDMVNAAVLRIAADGELIWVSPSWTQLTGHAVEATVGRPIWEFVQGNICSPIQDVLVGTGDGAVRRIDCSLSTVAGGSMQTELAVRRVSREDGCSWSGVLGVVIDMRERQRRELETRHDQKLESLGRLSAGIAHEINTPIQFVGDNARFLAEAYQEILDLLAVYRDCMDMSNGEIDLDERLTRAAVAEREADIDYLTAEVPVALQQCLEGIDRVATLVRAMKSFSYKDSRDRSYADLNEALTTTLTVARNEVKYVADVVLDLGELPEVLCRIGDLNQVFLNLLVNAADAMQDKAERGERGEIRISTRVEGPMAVVSIADNGSGIPEHLQQVIFEQFFTTKEVGKGTGQGLALARNVIVDGHGGSIEVHSTPGEGTEFVLRLPIDGKHPEQP
ncbi:hypothetical protein GCM10009835_30260 [Planosporangium flavigriseum]